ncbi:MAG: hypothetical protein ACFFAU_05625 [Candidatus Hodarchaeota archaeon]
MSNQSNNARTSENNIEIIDILKYLNYEGTVRLFGTNLDEAIE